MSTESIELSNLNTALVQLGGVIQAQGVGVSVKLDKASDKLSAAINAAALASERHAKSLVNATWALVAATVVLVIVTAFHVYFTLSHGQ
jgi:hypothetical protein